MFLNFSLKKDWVPLDKCFIILFNPLWKVFCIFGKRFIVGLITLYRMEINLKFRVIYNWLNNWIK